MKLGKQATKSLVEILSTFYASMLPSFVCFVATKCTNISFEKFINVRMANKIQISIVEHKQSFPNNNLISEESFPDFFTSEIEKMKVGQTTELTDYEKKIAYEVSNLIKMSPNITSLEQLNQLFIKAEFEINETFNINKTSVTSPEL